MFKNSGNMVKILIIEDDPYVQRMYKRMFSFKKYDIEIASHGEQGIELAIKNNPNLILLDIMLPGMNGLKVLEVLKKDPKTKKIPVLMLTNLGETAIVDEATKLGAESFMVKADFSPEQVIEEVEKYLNNPQSADKS